MSASEDAKQDTASNAASTAPGFTVKLHGWLAVGFFVLGGALLLDAFAGVAWPSWANSRSYAEYLTYGRAFPMALNALVFGWLTLGLVAALYYFVPRLTGGRLAFGGVALLGALVISAGTGSGVAALAIGEGSGGRITEMPWYSDVLLLVGFLIVAVVITSTVAGSEDESHGVPIWYAVAAPWWLFLTYAVGSIPGFTGIDAELQSAFTVTAVYGMWVAPAAIGLGYVLIARLVPDVRFHPRLGRIGFWSLGLVWAWTAARTFQYGPTPDWMETIPVLFSAALVVAAFAIVTDFALALRGRFDAVARSTSLGMYTFGTVLFLIVPGHMLLQSLRSSSSVIRFTAWESAFDLLVVLGAFSFWVAALVGHLLAPGAIRRLGGGTARWVMLFGGLFAVGTRWVAGLQQGYTWLGGVEADLYPNAGEGFVNTVKVLHGTDILTFIGLAIYAAGALLFLFGLGFPLAEESGEPRRRPLWVLIPGAAGLLAPGVLPARFGLSVVYVGLVLLAIGLLAFYFAPRLPRPERLEHSPVRPREASQFSSGERLGFTLGGLGLVVTAIGTTVLTEWASAAFWLGIALVAGGGFVLWSERDTRRGEPDRFDLEWPDLERSSVIRRGSVAVFALAFLAVFALPVLDSAEDATLLADSSRSFEEGSVEETGRDLYVAEGCWYCHTQQVRAIVTDLGLGPVSVAGDYVYDPPGILGASRIGPDLAHAGSRVNTSDAEWVALHLANPRAERFWSTMPSYSHLSDSDLNALAAYVAGLE